MGFMMLWGLLRIRGYFPFDLCGFAGDEMMALMKVDVFSALICQR